MLCTQIHLANSFKEKGNSFFVQEKYTAALHSYNDALLVLGLRALDSVSLFGLYSLQLIKSKLEQSQSLIEFVGVIASNRAACYIKRGWIGDYQSALSDAQVSIQLCPNYMKSYYRAIKSLQLLGTFDEALKLGKNSLLKFPGSKEVISLISEIQNEKEDVTSMDSDSVSDQNEEKKEKIPESLPVMDSYFPSSQTFIGQCNLRTDIKEACFCFDDRFVACGSDDGSVYFFEVQGNKLVHILKGVDPDIVNCLVAHPHEPVLATSGIDDVIKIWEPQFTAKPRSFSLDKLDEDLKSNQNSMSRVRLRSLDFQESLARIIAR